MSLAPVGIVRVITNVILALEDGLTQRVETPVPVLQSIQATAVGLISAGR